MKANEALKILGVSRPTLSRLVKSGEIRATKKESGHYIYDDESVYRWKTKQDERKTAAYIRIPSLKEGDDLHRQLDAVRAYGEVHGFPVDETFEDVTEAASLKERTGLDRLVVAVIEGQFARVIVEDKAVLGDALFDVCQYLFRKFRCQLLAVNEEEKESAT